MTNEPKKHKQAFDLWRQGLRKREIAQSLGVSVGTITFWASSKCKCQCGYHDWNSLVVPEEGEVVVQPEGVTPVITEDLNEYHRLLDTLTRELREALTNGTVQVKSWGDFLSALEFLKDAYSDLVTSSVVSKKVTATLAKKKQDLSEAEDGESFSEPDVDRLVDLFLEKHVITESKKRAADFDIDDLLEVE